MYCVKVTRVDIKITLFTKKHQFEIFSKRTPMSVQGSPIRLSETLYNLSCKSSPARKDYSVI